MHVFSFDAETNGLWGQAFAIAAIVYNEHGKERARFVGRCPIAGKVKKFVAENVLPLMEDIEVSHESYDALLASFAEFYLREKTDAVVITHMSVPVEAKVLIDMHCRGLIGDWDGPYPLLDVAGILKARGADSTSVDKYNEKYGLMVGRSEAHGLGTHHPLYDAISTAVAYIHLMGVAIPPEELRQQRMSDMRNVGGP
jgi:hypothetical protein